MSLKILYTSISDFLTHLLSRPIIRATFRLTFKKTKCPEGLRGAYSNS